MHEILKIASEMRIIMLKLNHIKKIYDKQEILTDVNYEFQEGKIYPILGGAGAGRTTLFECICGDVPIDGGSIETRSRGNCSLLPSKVFFQCIFQAMSLLSFYAHLRRMM